MIDDFEFSVFTNTISGWNILSTGPLYHCNCCFILPPPTYNVYKYFRKRMKSLLSISPRIFLRTTYFLSAKYCSLQEYHCILKPTKLDFIFRLPTQPDVFFVEHQQSGAGKGRQFCINHLLR